MAFQRPYRGNLSKFLQPSTRVRGFGIRRGSGTPAQVIDRIRGRIQKNVLLKMGNPPTKKRSVTFRMVNPYYIPTKKGKFGVTQAQYDLGFSAPFRKLQARVRGMAFRKQFQGVGRNLLKRQKAYRVGLRANQIKTGRLKVGFGIRR